MSSHSSKIAAEHKFAKALVERLPDKVRVGPYDFWIEKWPATTASDNQRYGEMSSIEQTIRIQLDMPTRYKALDTFFHEVSHAIFWVYGLGDDDKEEETVSVFGTGMAALYRDNPWILDWVKSARL